MVHLPAVLGKKLSPWIIEHSDTVLLSMLSLRHENLVAGFKSCSSDPGCSKVLAFWGWQTGSRGGRVFHMCSEDSVTLRLSWLRMPQYLVVFKLIIDIKEVV